MKSWVIKVCSPGLTPFWLGSFEAPSRALAKPAARAFACSFVNDVMAGTRLTGLSDGR